MIKRNAKYLSFSQSEFTVGDLNQFEELRQKRGNVGGDINISDNLFVNNTLNSSIIKKEGVKNTLLYMFYKFKKGIFVKILNNKLDSFIPFNNNNFENEWSDLVEMPSNEFMKNISERQGHSFFETTTNENKKEWVANNGLIRIEHPLNHGGISINILKSMFEELLRNRKVPNCEFFVNRRDFPMLRKDRNEAYDCFFGENTPLLSHNYDCYAPIFSMSSNDSFEDIPIPTWDDWARISKEFDLKKDYSIQREEWENKKNIAVFRGGSTGLEVTTKTNMRLKIATMKHPHLDAGITSWNLRPRKIYGERELKTINENIELVSPLSYEEQGKYKYIINIPGHVCAFRLSVELGLESVILIVEGKYDIWYSKMLENGIHYISVKSDLSNLIEKIEWCLEHDDECRKIARNARKFYEKYLCKNGVMDYLQFVLCETFRNCSYEYETQIEESTFNREFAISYLPKYPRSWHLHEGIRLLLNENYKLKLPKRGVQRKETMWCNELMKIVPNIIFTYGEWNGTVYEEQLENYTLEDYLNSDEYNWETAVDYLISILLSLKIAKEMNGFEHNNLFCDTILFDKGGIWDYCCENENESAIYRLNLNKTPIMTDLKLASQYQNNDLDITSLIRSFVLTVRKKTLKKYQLYVLYTLGEYLGNEKVTNLKKFYHKQIYYKNRDILKIISILRSNLQAKKLRELEKHNKLFIPIDGSYKQVMEFAQAGNKNGRDDSYNNVCKTLQFTRFPLTRNKTLATYFEFIFNRMLDSIKQLSGDGDLKDYHDVKGMIKKIYRRKDDNTPIENLDFDSRYINRIVNLIQLDK